MRETCKNCIWADICDIANRVKATECPDYYNSEENGEGMVEQGREEYYKAWAEYLKDDE